VAGEQSIAQFKKHLKEPLSPVHDAPLRRVRWLSNPLDERYRIPGTRYRIGLDGLLGFLPGIGDTIGALLSLYILFEAIQLGIPGTTLLRMVANIGLDTVVGAIPVVGDVFDIAWKANKKNADLLSVYVASQAAKSPGRVQIGEKKETIYESL
jgi:hypothetical protein